MAAKRGFEDQITALDALRQQPEEARVEPLHKALGHRNNFIVAKAADLVREFRLAKLTPDLLQAFDRFFETPEKTDPQCWAKNALSRALAALEYQEAEVFLRGMRHIQMEPVWGGRSDTAGTLRATCALALVQCRSLTDADLLAHLIELLGDKDKAVRAEAARAIEQVGSLVRLAPAPPESRSRGRRTRSAGRLLQRNLAHRRRQCDSLGRTFPGYGR